MHMTGKHKKRLVCFLALLAYSAGALFTPILADSTSGFDALLEHRENHSFAPSEQVEKQTSLQDFTDIKQNDWFYPYLDYLVENGLIKGVTETEFQPNGNFSYAECSTVITRYLGLEKEAAEYKKHLEKEYGIKPTIWYSGYFQVMQKLGLFEGYGLFETDGKWICSIDTSLSNEPISRYRFAESISRSFELDSSLEARNIYSEIGGDGREFIAGGAYNESILSQYEEYISDFDEIPEDSRIDVLKAYYNGIFMGDEQGLFNPLNNLTRAEMAKVLATVCNYSLRERLIVDGYAPNIQKDSLFTDSLGNVSLCFDAWKEILEQEVEFVSGHDGIIEYCNGFSAPMGYAVDVYLYTRIQSGIYGISAQSTLNDFSDGEISAKTDDGRILMVLRNLVENGRTEGVIDISITDGQIEKISPMIREM